MTKKLSPEQLSSLIDGEAEATDADQADEAIADSPELQAKLGRYYLIRDALKATLSQEFEETIVIPARQPLDDDEQLG